MMTVIFGVRAGFHDATDLLYNLYVLENVNSRQSWIWKSFTQGLARFMTDMELYSQHEQNDV